jgi:caa(3)-type oxidase subunit IV
LIFFTAVTVALSYVELPTHSMNIIVGMIVATFKAALVALIFMHLNHERPLIYKVLAFTVVFALAIFFLTYFASNDPLVFDNF